MREVAENWLQNWFHSRGKVSSSQINADYFAAGWLTSMEVVEFVTEIEQQFEICFSDEDLQDQRFVTIAGLAELIEVRSSQLRESN